VRRSPLRRTVYAFWVLGGVPRRHCSDSLSAAVNDLSAKREFRAWYEGLLNHYGVRDERINCVSRTRTAIRSRHPVTSRPAVDQALQLRGSRDFASLDHPDVLAARTGQAQHGPPRASRRRGRVVPTAPHSASGESSVFGGDGGHRPSGAPQQEASRAIMASGRHGCSARSAERKSKPPCGATRLRFPR
jgi:hypothetical protein